MVMDLHSVAVDSVLNGNGNEIFGDNASKIKLFSVSINGVETDVAVCEYINQVLLIVTQFQKIGTLISVVKGSVKNLSGSDDVYEVKTICGLDNQEFHTAARFLSSQLNISKPILFGISLKDFQPKILKALAQVIQEHL